MADEPIPPELGDIVKQAMKPEHTEPGPGDVGPTISTRASTTNPGSGPLQLVTLPYTEESIGKWWKEIALARSRVKKRAEKWDILLKEYEPVIEAAAKAEDVKTNGHFRNVHTKMGQLFYRSPDIILTPKDPGPANNIQPSLMPPQPGQPPPPPMKMEDVIEIKQAVLTQKLGRDGIKADRLMDELLFDVLAWSGIGCCKVGYKCVFKKIQQPKMQPAPPPQAPPPGPGSVLGLQTPPQAPQTPQMVPMMDEMGQPVMETVSVPIWEEEYARRFSPKKALWNDDLKSTRHDEDARWKGMEFFMSPKQAMLPPDQGGLGLTEQEASKAGEDEFVHKYELDEQGEQRAPGLVHGVEIECRASFYTDEPHPKALCQLILVEGVKDRPIVWRPCPDQEFDPKTGKLTEDSRLDFAYRTLTIRDLPDSPFPMSDSAFTNNIIKQLNTWRRQSIRLRDAAIGKYLYDQGAFDETEIEKIRDSEVGTYVGVIEGKMAQGIDKILGTTPQVTNAHDDFRNSELLKRDNDETLGIGSVQSGTPESTVHTATEISQVSSAVNARNDKELARCVDFYLDLVRIVDQLVMRYATDTEYITITGDQGSQIMKAWNNKVVSGRYLYAIAPDSQLREDTERDYQLLLNLYNQAAKDPLCNRSYILNRLFRMRRLDPKKAILPPAPPPQPQPDKPSISFAFKAEDLADPMVRAILMKAELLDPSMFMSDPNAPIPQPAHGGSADVANKHAASNSGKRENEPGAVNHRDMVGGV